MSKAEMRMVGFTIVAVIVANIVTPKVQSTLGI